MTMVLQHKRELSVAGAYAALLLILAALAPAFFRQQFAATWVSIAPLLVAGIGMMLVILTRQIDVSVGAQFSICAVVAGLTAKSGAPLSVVFVAALVAGAIMGTLNAMLVVLMGLPSIVATLATMVLFREGLRWARQGQSVHGLPHDFQWFGLSQSAGQWAIVSIALAVFVVFAVAMRWLTAGRAVYAVGSDQEAARLAGIDPKRMTFGVFVLMGAMVGLAATLASVRFAQVDANAGSGLELQVIAAVVVGGTAIAGGRGTIFGTLLGVALLGTIGAALGFLSDQAYWDKALQGVIILAAVSSDGIYGRDGQ